MTFLRSISSFQSHDKSEQHVLFKTDQSTDTNMPQIVALTKIDIPYYLTKLIELRAATYREYPYLYEQNLDDEKEYVTQYTNNDHTVLVLAKNDFELSGMVIGLPLSTAQDWIKEAFAKYDGRMDEVFYVGDIVTAQTDENLKNALLDNLESILKEQKKFSTLAVCEVYRDECPKENAQIDQYWTSKGYQKCEDLQSVFWWKDRDKDQKTPKTLIYWLKRI